MSKESQSINSEILEFLALEKAIKEEIKEFGQEQTEQKQNKARQEVQKQEICIQNQQTDLEKDLAYAVQALNTYRQLKKQQEQSLHTFKPIFKLDNQEISLQGKNKAVQQISRKSLEFRPSKIRQLKNQIEAENQNQTEKNPNLNLNLYKNQDIRECLSLNELKLSKQQSKKNNPFQIKELDNNNHAQYKNSPLTPSIKNEVLSLGEEFKLINQNPSRFNSITVLEKARYLEEENLIMEQKYQKIREQVKLESQLQESRHQNSNDSVSTRDSNISKNQDNLLKLVHAMQLIIDC